jgi:Fuc2NAc and GlcNAc transferase
MNLLFFLIQCMTAALVVYLLCGQLRRHALWLGLMDIPNDRSSHTSPVPRGGGVTIALVFLVLLPFLQAHFPSYRDLFTSLYGCGILIALVGFMDDRNHIPAPFRLVVHFVAAAWAIYFSSGVYAPVAAAPSVSLFTLHSLMALFLLVWLLNLYNFMDGIDAITGSETLTITLGAALITWLLFPQDPSWQILLLIACSVTGFLFWNLPPAKLFMGDSGSAFLGIIIGVVVLHALQLSLQLFYAWIILLAVYIVDSNVTLIRRILNGQRFYQAHRTHAYQHAARRFQSHGKVSVAIALINLFWLLPAATAVALGLFPGPITILITYLPLVALSFHFKAGTVQPHS